VCVGGGGGGGGGVRGGMCRIILFNFEICIPVLSTIFSN